MESVLLALLVGVFGVGLMLYQDHYRGTHGARDNMAGVVRPGLIPNDQPHRQELGVTMKFDAPSPRCDGTPVEILEMLDGKAWICPHCGHQETEGAADIDAFVEKIGCHDPEMMASWRAALGLGPK